MLSGEHSDLMEFVGKLEQGNHSCLTLPTMQQTADP